MVDLLSFVLGCSFYKSLIKHAYQLPPPPALLIIVFVSTFLCVEKWAQIFFAYLSTNLLVLTGLKLCWDLNLTFNSVPVNFNSPSPAISLLSFIPWVGSHEIFISNQHLLWLLLVKHFTNLVSVLSSHCSINFFSLLQTFQQERRVLKEVILQKANVERWQVL